jgi:hypothetical protein
MSLDERGLLISLLCECWVNRGVPAKPEELAKWLGFPSDKIQSALTQNVLSFFADVEGELHSPELERYRNEILAQREKMSQGGKKGVQAKQRRASLPEGYPEGSRVEMSRDEMSRGGSLKKDDSSIDDAWVKAYDEAQYDRY